MYTITRQSDMVKQNTQNQFIQGVCREDEKCKLYANNKKKGDK